MTKFLNGYNVIVIGLPLYLIVFEWFMRELNGINMGTYIGPTLASSGITLLIGVFQRKMPILNSRQEKIVKTLGPTVNITDKSDDNLIWVCAFFFLICLLIWYLSCMTSYKMPFGYVSFLGREWCYSPSFALGSANYLIGIIFIYLKFKEND